MTKKKKIVQVVVRNTSTLDVTLPLYAHISNVNENYDVSILYMSLNKAQLVRETTQYRHYLRLYKCREYDYLDFMKIKSTFLQKLLRKIFSCSIYDRVPLNKAFALFPRNDSYKCVFPSVRIKVSNWITRNIIDIDHIFTVLEPDIVLLDYREKIKDQSIEIFARSWKNNSVKVVLLPHAPHDIRECSEYIPYKYDKDELPLYCFYWEPFIYHQTWKMNVKRKQNFIYFGYPGLDSQWLQSLNGENNDKVEMNGNNYIKILLVIRKFYPEDSSGNSNEYFIQSYQEVFKQVRLTVDALNNSTDRYELIIKPHPSASIEDVREMLVKINVINFKISYQPYFNILEEVDMVVSSFSTTMVIPPLYGLPIVIYNDRTMAYVEEWEILKHLYGGFEFYSDNDDAYQNNINKIIKAYVMDKNLLRQSIERDRKHVRAYFPDYAAYNVVEILNNLSI